jgi:hypothetical protein
MADEFDRFLKQALAPPERDEDHKFVARVQAAIRIEQQLQLERRSLVRTLVLQLVVIAAVAAALFSASRAPAVAALVAHSPDLARVVLVGAFAALVGLLTAGAAGSPSSAR